MSKKAHIRKALEQGRSLNSLVAMKEFSTMRLAAYIYMLRAEGLNISTTEKTTFHGDRYAEYKLVQEEPNEDQTTEGTTNV